MSLSFLFEYRGIQFGEIANENCTVHGIRLLALPSVPIRMVMVQDPGLALADRP